MVRVVLFDFDGTLVNTTPLILRSFRATWEEVYGFSFEDHVYIQTFGTLIHSAIGYLIDLGVETGRHGPPADRQARIEEILIVYRRFNLGWHDKMIEPFPEVPEMLAQLKQRGFAMGIVSSKIRAGVERGLKIFEMVEYFDLIVSAEDVTNHKPHPEPINRALERLRVPPGEALYLGDSIHDVIAGQAARVITAAAAWGPFPRIELEELQPDYILDSPRQLTGILEIEEEDRSANGRQEA